MRQTTRIVVNGPKNYPSLTFEGFNQRENNAEISFRVGRDVKVKVMLTNNSNYTPEIVRLDIPQISENKAQYTSVPISRRNTQIGKFWYYLGRAIIQEYGEIFLEENNN